MWGREQRRAAACASCALALALATNLLGPPQAAVRDGETEYRVKAAFLFNFARFVEWSAPPDDVMRICVLAPDPFGDVLDRTVADKRVHGRPFEVVRLETLEATPRCDMLFVPGLPPEHEADVVRAASGPGVLTVGDDSPFAERGGVINFVVADGHVGFEINRDAASRAGLRISSKLLGLARIVEDRPRGRGRP